MNADDTERSIYSFVRRNKNGKQHMLFVINMTPVEYPKYRVGVPMNTQYKLVLNSDEERFGGNGNKLPKTLKARKGLCDNRDQYIAFALPPLTAVVYEF
jgi:1,4-alpha-glucan branching enzyme